MTFSKYPVRNNDTQDAHVAYWRRCVGMLDMSGQVIRVLITRPIFRCPTGSREVTGFFGNGHIRLLLTCRRAIWHTITCHTIIQTQLVDHSVVRVTTGILQMLCCYWLHGSVMCRCFETSSNTSETVTFVRKHVTEF